MVGVETIAITGALVVIDALALKEYLYLQGELEKLKQGEAQASKEPVLTSIAEQVAEPVATKQAEIDYAQQAHAVVDAAMQNEVQKARESTETSQEKMFKVELGKVDEQLSQLEQTMSSVKEKVAQPSGS